MVEAELDVFGFYTPIVDAPATDSPSPSPTQVTMAPNVSFHSPGIQHSHSLTLPTPKYTIITNQATVYHPASHCACLKPPSPVISSPISLVPIISKNSGEYSMEEMFFDCLPSDQCEDAYEHATDSFHDCYKYDLTEPSSGDASWEELSVGYSNSFSFPLGFGWFSMYLTFLQAQGVDWLLASFYFGLIQPYGNLYLDYHSTIQLIFGMSWFQVMFNYFSGFYSPQHFLGIPS